MARTDRSLTMAARSLLTTGMMILVAMLVAACGPADDPPKLRVDLPDVLAPDLSEPYELTTLQELAAEIDDEDIGTVLYEGLRDTALALGAQAGLARKAFQINAMLDRHKIELDRIYQLRRLAITAPNGSIVMPPIVTESVDHYRVSGDGQGAKAFLPDGHLWGPFWSRLQLAPLCPNLAGAVGEGTPRVGLDEHVGRQLGIFLAQPRVGHGGDAEGFEVFDLDFRSHSQYSLVVITCYLVWSFSKWVCPLRQRIGQD